jgi:hypothetical protein
MCDVPKALTAMHKPASNALQHASLDHVAAAVASASVAARVLMQYPAAAGTASGTHLAASPTQPAAAAHLLPTSLA